MQSLLLKENMTTYIAWYGGSKGAYIWCEYLKDQYKIPLTELDQEGNLRGRHVEDEYMVFRFDIGNGDE
jgi:hypothetical protein